MWIAQRNVIKWFHSLSHSSTISFSYTYRYSTFKFICPRTLFASSSGPIFFFFFLLRSSENWYEGIFIMFHDRTGNAYNTLNIIIDIVNFWLLYCHYRFGCDECVKINDHSDETSFTEHNTIRDLRLNASASSSSSSLLLWTALLLFSFRVSLLLCRSSTYNQPTKI